MVEQLTAAVPYPREDDDAMTNGPYVRDGWCLQHRFVRLSQACDWVHLTYVCWDPSGLKLMASSIVFGTFFPLEEGCRMDVDQCRRNPSAVMAIDLAKPRLVLSALGKRRCRIQCLNSCLGLLRRKGRNDWTKSVSRKAH